MKLLYPKQINNQQARALKLCMARAVSGVSWSEAYASVAANLCVIEAGVKVVARQFAVPKLGEIDIIATDKFGRGLFVNICDTLSGAELCRAFQKTDWMIENVELIQNFHPGIKAGRDARQIVVAGAVSADARSMIARIGAKGFDVFEYTCLKLGGEDWMILQKFDIGRDKVHVDLVNSETNKPVAVETFGMKSMLTPEEIGDFFDKSMPSGEVDDEVTMRFNLSQM